MMVPDYWMIAEIALFSYGFEDARDMARKIVKVLQLASEQLSSQKHYDYGMRAVKTILTAAGNLKRALPWREDEIVLRAIFDANIPKFTTSDIPLFQGIAMDLFPTTVIPTAVHNGVDDAVVAVCKRTGLQPHPTFVTKCLQLHETVRVRHGVMVVGQTMSGKTAVLRTLARALTSISVEAKAEELGRAQAMAAAKAKEEADKRRREDQAARARNAPSQRQQVRAILRRQGSGSGSGSDRSDSLVHVGGLGPVRVSPRRRESEVLRAMSAASAASSSASGSAGCVPCARNVVPVAGRALRGVASFCVPV